MRNSKDYPASKLLFVRDAHHWIFYPCFSVFVGDGFFRRTGIVHLPSIGISAVNAFDAKSIGRNYGSFNWFAVWILHDNQNFFEFCVFWSFYFLWGTCLWRGLFGNRTAGGH